MGNLASFKFQLLQEAAIIAAAHGPLQEFPSGWIWDLFREALGIASDGDSSGVFDARIELVVGQ